MRNCIKADLRRVQKKVSFLVCTGIVVVLFLLAGLLAKILPLRLGEIQGSAMTMDLYASAVLFFFPLLTGIPIFSAVYSDDFKSRSMQTAIGFGLTRQKIIWARFFEGMLLLVETGIIYSAFLVLTEVMNGVSGDNIRKTLINELWIKDLKILGFLCLSLIIVYGTQKPSGGLVLFILLISGVFGTMISAMDLIPFFDKHNIEPSKYFPSGVITTLQDAISDGHAGKAVVAFVCFAAFYVILPVFISIGIFDKKELDF